MNFADFSLTLLLILPGFILLHLVFLISRFRRLSSFYAAVWSLLTGLLLFNIIYLIYTSVLPPPADGAPWPDLAIVLTEPGEVPLGVWIALYVGSILLGLTLGILDSMQIIEKALLRVGIDLRKHGDLWDRLFRERPARYVIVYLKDGDILAGWPKHYSDDRTDPGPELYLSPVSIWEPVSDNWATMDYADGVLVHGAEISRIEFLKADAGNGPDA